MTRRQAALLVDALEAGYAVHSGRSGLTIIKLVGRWRKAAGLTIDDDGTAFVIGVDLAVAAGIRSYEVMRRALGIPLRGRRTMQTTANPIRVGDRVHYWSSRQGQRGDTLVGGIVAERAPSPLGTGDRLRVVDSAGEMADPDAGRWIAATDPIWAGPVDPAE